MKNRSLLLALLLCFGLSTPALPSGHAETSEAARKKKKKNGRGRHGPPPHAQPAASSSAASAKAKAPGHHRIIPATSTAVDEDTTRLAAAPIEVDPNRPPTVLARSVILLNARTGETLFEKNADEPRQIASTTKLMTALLVAEAGNLRDQVTVEPIDTVCEPTKLYFKPGEHYARNALLYALLVHSCNDVARCLARDNAGSFDAFADKMNARAAQLGARDTHFVTPNGLPAPGEDQHSTARDLSRIARVVYFNQTLRPIMATQHLQFQMASGKTQEFANTNKVLLRYPLLQRHEDRLHRRRRSLPGVQRGRRHQRGHQRLPGRQPGDLERLAKDAGLRPRRRQGQANRAEPASVVQPARAGYGKRSVSDTYECPNADDRNRVGWTFHNGGS